VYGVPGFETTDQVEEASFDRIGEADAIAVATGVFGVEATSAERLDTERDDTFRLVTPRGSLVLKVAHPADAAEDLDFQTAALEWAQRRDGLLPLQQLRPSTAGTLTPTLAGHGGRVARLFEWLPGELLIDVPPDDDQLRALGGALGRLTRALDGFEHPRMTRPFAWDLAQFPRLRQVLDRFPHDDLREVFTRFEQRVTPRLAELPRQVIHNDFNPGNVLVDPSDPSFVTGILDFGDAIHTIRIADVAVALCYQLYPSARDWSSVQPLLDAYEDRVPLTGTEHDVLKTLVEARFAQRVLINEWLSQFEDDRGRDQDFRNGVRASLRELLEED
jgi:Ser/Thr protein kinase RdoA (MazF antagonist)